MKYALVLLVLFYASMSAAYECEAVVSHLETIITKTTQDVEEILKSLPQPPTCSDTKKLGGDYGENVYLTLYQNNCLQNPQANETIQLNDQNISNGLTLMTINRCNPEYLKEMGTQILASLKSQKDILAHLLP